MEFGDRLDRITDDLDLGVKKKSSKISPRFPPWTIVVPFSEEQDFYLVRGNTTKFIWGT